VDTTGPPDTHARPQPGNDSAAGPRASAINDGGSRLSATILRRKTPCSLALPRSAGCSGHRRRVVSAGLLRRTGYLKRGRRLTLRVGSRAPPPACCRRRSYTALVPVSIALAAAFFMLRAGQLATLVGPHGRRPRARGRRQRAGQHRLQSRGHPGARSRGCSWTRPASSPSRWSSPAALLGLGVDAACWVDVRPVQAAAA